MKTAPMMYRQGDVGIVRIDQLPASAIDVTPEDRIVLAYGEVTGHAHAIAPGEAREYSMAQAGAAVRRFLSVVGSQKAESGRVIRRTQTLIGEQLLLETNTGPVAFASADVVDAGATATPRADWSAVRHEEHDAHGLLGGLYEILAQREYTPEAILNVAD